MTEHPPAGPPPRRVNRSPHERTSTHCGCPGCLALRGIAWACIIAFGFFAVGMALARVLK